MTDAVRPLPSAPRAGDPLAILAVAVAVSIADLADLTRTPIDLEAIGRRLRAALARLPAHLTGSTPAAAVRTVCSYVAAGSAHNTYSALLTAQDTMPVRRPGAGPPPERGPIRP